MTPWSESEVFDFLETHFGRAADNCEQLARRTRRGHAYNELRRDLEKIEDMCRVVHYMRQDSRWLRIGMQMQEAHKRAGNWLRGIPQSPTPSGTPRPALRLPPGTMHPLFVKL